MVKDHTCGECDRLWLEYADALTAHLKIVGCEQVAAMQQNSVEIKRLGSLADIAREARLKTRDAIKKHEPLHGEVLAQI